MLGTPCAAGLTVGAEAGAASPAPARLVDDSPCPPGHNTPFPLKRSPPVSFKRLLGGTPLLSPPTCQMVCQKTARIRTELRDHLDPQRAFRAPKGSCAARYEAWRHWPCTPRIA